MFDEENNNANPPGNLPAEPADIFAGVEKEPAEQLPDALSNGMLKKKDKTMVPPQFSGLTEENSIGNYKMSSPVLGKVLMLFMVALLLGGGAYGAWWFFLAKKKTVSQPAVNSAPKTSASNTVANPASSTNLPAQINNDQILFGQGVDTDKDGLDDVREREIGTNPQNPDTDGDGLTDGEEVITLKSSPLNSDTDNDGLSDGDEVLIWKTNILNPDSDNDTYPDGTEVKNGYNPLGPGKLFAPVASSTISVSSTSSSAK